MCQWWHPSNQSERLTAAGRLIGQATKEPADERRRSRQKKKWTHVESLTTLAPPREPYVHAGRDGFTGHRSGPRTPVLCTPGARLSWFAETPEAALAGLRELVDEVVADTGEAGEGVPEPLSKRHYSGKL